MSPIPDMPTLAEAIAERFRESILEGRISPAERLVEAEIARNLGVSRGPVREALAKLVGEGLIRSEGRGALKVVPMSPRDLRSIYELRAAIESQAARMVAADVTDSDRGRLDAHLETLRDTADRDDRVGFALADLNLHAELCELASPRLRAVWDQQVGIVQVLARLELTSLYDSLDGLFDSHERLVKVVLSGNEAEAAEVARLHCIEAADQIARIREVRGLAVMAAMVHPADDSESSAVYVK